MSVPVLSARCTDSYDEPIDRERDDADEVLPQSSARRKSALYALAAHVDWCAS